MDRVKELMQLLDCTEKEALSIIEEDKIIDKGGRTWFDLDKEDEKAAKKWANVTEHKVNAVDAYGRKRTRTRKENATKSGIIQELFDFLSEHSEFVIKNIKITNKERQIAFEIGTDKFELTLVQKRKPKGGT